jgi:SAM-dependent methyltransferase/mannose-6-phosphate isomerase-like protein (cupin superfamily)
MSLQIAPQSRINPHAVAEDVLAEMKIMQFVYSVPTLPSFKNKGLVGYDFGPLNHKDVEIICVDVEKGHDVFMISKRIARIYYIVSGSGCFTIADHKYDVSAGMLVEVPPTFEFCYSGKMKLIVFSTPRWFGGNDTFTKWNPDVVPWGDLTPVADDGSWLMRLARLRIFGKSPLNAYLRLNQRLWNKLPAQVTALGPIHSYGHALHTLSRLSGARSQAFSTHFLRNRPQLELIRRLVERRADVDALRVAVLGCSTGAEAYSVAWTIRSTRPQFKLVLHAVDISSLAVEVGKSGVYSLTPSQLTTTDLFERLTSAEIEEFFDRDGDTATVKSWIKEGIKWSVGDVGEPQILDALGPQDIVVANNFLCHLDDPMAERCLRNIARLVSPGGYLFVSGIDLDIRTKVASDLGWNPVQELLEEIHEGDPGMRSFWPCLYAGLEPLNKNRQDWIIRYAAAFQLVPSADVVRGGGERSMRPVTEASAESCARPGP